MSVYTDHINRRIADLETFKGIAPEMTGVLDFAIAATKKGLEYEDLGNAVKARLEIMFGHSLTYHEADMWFQMLCQVIMSSSVDDEDYDDESIFITCNRKLCNGIEQMLGIEMTSAIRADIDQIVLSLVGCIAE